jgi:hypothetical protein
MIGGMVGVGEEVGLVVLVGFGVFVIVGVRLLVGGGGVVVISNILGEGDNGLRKPSVGGRNKASSVVGTIASICEQETAIIDKITEARTVVCLIGKYQGVIIPHLVKVANSD